MIPDITLSITITSLNLGFSHSLNEDIKSIIMQLGKKSNGSCESPQPLGCCDFHLNMLKGSFHF